MSAGFQPQCEGKGHMQANYKMKTLLIAISIFFLQIIFANAEDIIELKPFDHLHVYQPSGTPSAFFILISGDGGWVRAAPDVAETFSKQGTLVVGVEIKRYLAGVKHSKGCISVAEDLLNLSNYIQKKYNVQDKKPVLVGYSSGATLVYAALAQSPPGEFQGALSFGFCPDFEPAVDFCPGNGLEWTNGPVEHSVLLKPSQNIKDPWIAFQGTNDQVCDPHVTEDFVKQVSGGQFILCPKAGHGFGHLANWLPEFKQIWTELQAPNLQ
jgi:dienelactone hydrolase